MTDGRSNGTPSIRIVIKKRINTNNTKIRVLPNYCTKITNVKHYQCFNKPSLKLPVLDQKTICGNTFYGFRTPLVLKSSLLEPKMHTANSTETSFRSQAVQTEGNFSYRGHVYNSPPLSSYRSVRVMDNMQAHNQVSRLICRNKYWANKICSLLKKCANHN